LIPPAKKVFFLLGLALYLSSCDKISFKPAETGPRDTVYLKNGGIIQGTLVKETPEEISVRWQDGIVTFKRLEVAEIRRGVIESVGEEGIALPKKASEAPESRDPATYPRLYLRSGEVKKGVVVKPGEQELVIGEKLEGGGLVEFSFRADEVDRIDLWPMPAPEMTAAFEEVKKDFRAAELHEKDHYAILSDDDAMDLNLFTRTLEQFYDEFILYFLSFVKAEYQPRKLNAVIFGEHGDFKELLDTAGFPENSPILGFFTPESRILFLYNIKSQEMVERYLHGSSHVEDAVKGRMEELSHGEWGDGIEQSRILGEGERILEALEKDRIRVEAEALEETMKTIRHEGAHQLLFEFDVHAKEARQGAWLVEGLASFCEPTPIGDIHEARLMQLKFELESHQLMPLEYLLSFAAGGDIHRMEASYASLAYAQSWAFVHFLMSGPYRQVVLAYMREVSGQGKDFDEKKDLALLERHLGKPVKEVEAEFETYVHELIASHVEDKKYEEFRFRMLLAQ
jgi:hypothetical protein